MSGINQKEYLKKYLGIGKGSGEKKKKKKPKKLGNGLKIVDDDVDGLLNEEIQVDLTADNDEAPQIVSVIDDRPPSLRIDEESHNKMWKPIGAPDVSEQSLKFEGNIKLSKLGVKQASSMKKRELSPVRKNRESKTASGPNPARMPGKSGQTSSKTQGKISVSSSDQDFSPVRQRQSKGISSPRREKTQKDSGSDNSPPKRRLADNSPATRNRSGDSDNSPPRRSRVNTDKSPVKKRRKGDDSSPPRRRQSRDMSPLRSTHAESDSSPPRRSKAKIQRDLSPPRKDQDPAKKRRKSDDSSPPRRRQSRDMSPLRPTHAESDSSSPRRSKAKIQRDLSPPRKDQDTSPRKIKTETRVDNSPPRRRKDNKRSRWGDSEDTTEKMEKTLDGKTAGLQNAADLVRETLELKKREDELFKKLSSEVSGVNAATIVRRKENEVDVEEEQRKRKIEEENMAKYNRWGKGLKQVEDVNEKMKSDLYEMSKPLARYADDEDLEKHLKDQEREGDPMLAYIRQKKRKNAVVEGKPALQQYEGDAPPNRFGIRPGYRWDGVDRSSGYEKKWFEVQNTRQANMEENYKWSTEDM